jgi:hypothetical protein
MLLGPCGFRLGLTLFVGKIPVMEWDFGRKNCEIYSLPYLG